MTGRQSTMPERVLGTNGLCPSVPHLRMQCSIVKKQKSMTVPPRTDKRRNSHAASSPGMHMRKDIGVCKFF